MKKEDSALGKLLDNIEKLAKEDRKVTIGQIVEVLGGRSYGPFLLFPALLEMSPIGGIPGLPTALAAIIIVFAAQIAIGKEHMWLPQFIKKRQISCDRILKALPSLRKMARFLDRWFHGRLESLTKGIWLRVAALCVICLALTVPPLELLPFASTAPMAAIAAFGLALLVGDGLLMALAFVAAGLALAIGVGVVGK